MLNQMTVTNKTTVAQMREFLDSFFKVAKFDESKNAKLAEIKKDYSTSKKEVLLSDVKFVNVVLERAQNKQKATAQPEKKAPEKKAVASLKKPETKKAPKKAPEKPVWKMPESFELNNMLYTKVDSTPENTKKFVDGELVIGWHMEKSQFSKKHVYDFSMPDAFNEAVAKNFPFVENLEVVTSVAYNDFQTVTQSLCTTCFNRLSYVRMDAFLEAGEMGFYTATEKAPEKKAPEKKAPASKKPAQKKTTAKK